MTLAIMQLRLLTLDKMLHKKRCRLSEMQQEKDAMSLTYTNASRLYKQIYLQLNGVSGTVSEEMNQSLTNQLGELEPILQMMNEKENEIDLEIQETNSEIASYSEELKNVKQWINSNTKKETAHYSSS